MTTDPPSSLCAPSGGTFRPRYKKDLSPEEVAERGKIGARAGLRKK
jgi:hypothetical protein